MFTDKELEKFVLEYKIAGKDNQEIIKRIHTIFGGEYHEKDNYQYNYVMIRLHNGIMYVVYNVHSETFIFKAPNIESQVINQWKLKKVVEKIKRFIKNDKKHLEKIKMAKIGEMF